MTTQSPLIELARMVITEHDEQVARVIQQSERRLTELFSAFGVPVSSLGIAPDITIKPTAEIPAMERPAIAPVEVTEMPQEPPLGTCLKHNKPIGKTGKCRSCLIEASWATRKRAGQEAPTVQEPARTPVEPDAPSTEPLEAQQKQDMRPEAEPTFPPTPGLSIIIREQMKEETVHPSFLREFDAGKHKYRLRFDMHYLQVSESEREYYCVPAFESPKPDARFVCRCELQHGQWAIIRYQPTGKLK